MSHVCTLRDHYSPNCCYSGRTSENISKSWKMNLRVAVAKACCSFPGPWELCLPAGGSVLQPLVHESCPDKWMSWSTGQSIGMSAALLCFFISWGNKANGTDLCKLLGNVRAKSTVSNLSYELLLGKGWQKCDGASSTTCFVLVSHMMWAETAAESWSQLWKPQSQGKILRR